jgi:pyrroline-5-carboxylate reductase
MKVVILGSGNLGTQLRYALLDAGHEILQVWHRNEKIVAGADVYIICVKDDAINIVFNQIEQSGVLQKTPSPIVVHTAGSVPMGSLSGVLYPMQSFSKNRGLISLRFLSL